MNTALLYIYFHETLPESNTGLLRLIVADIESFPRRIKISFADYKDMLFYLYMYSKDRFLFFTRFITSKAIKPARLEAKNIILEFNISEDVNLSSEVEEVDLDQDVNSQSDLLPSSGSFSLESSNDK